MCVSWSFERLLQQQDRQMFTVLEDRQGQMGRVHTSSPIVVVWDVLRILWRPACAELAVRFFVELQKQLD